MFGSAKPSGFSTLRIGHSWLVAVSHVHWAPIAQELYKNCNQIPGLVLILWYLVVAHTHTHTLLDQLSVKHPMRNKCPVMKVVIPNCCCSCSRTDGKTRFVSCWGTNNGRKCVWEELTICDLCSMQFLHYIFVLLDIVLFCFLFLLFFFASLCFFYDFFLLLSHCHFFSLFIYFLVFTPSYSYLSSRINPFWQVYYSVAEWFCCNTK